MKIDLTSEQREILEQFTRCRNRPQWLIVRSRIILLLAEGVSIRQVAKVLSISRNTVRVWARRWVQESHTLGEDNRKPALDPPVQQRIVQILQDQPRCGRPVTFTAEQVVAIVAVGLQAPAEFGRPVSHWSPTELAQEVIKQGIVRSISSRSVGRFLKSG